jgi:hypothetical protein
MANAENKEGEVGCASTMIGIGIILIFLIILIASLSGNIGDDSKQPSVDKLRQIDDPEKAEQYFNENWNSLLKEEWERQDRQRK